MRNRSIQFLIYSLLTLVMCASFAVAAPIPLSGIQIRDGKARNAPVAFPGLPATIAPNSTVRQASADGELLLQIAPQPAINSTIYPVTVTNQTDAQQWLLVRAVVNFTPNGNWQFFNGNFSAKNPRQRRYRQSIKYTMPMVAAFDQDNGVGLGFDPTELYSHLENELTPSNGKFSLANGVKVVLDPRDSLTIRFVTFDFAPRWGELAAVAAYQNIYPQVFNPNPATDMRLVQMGNAGSAPFWYQPSPETIRRLRLGADWAYATVKTAGEWYGRPESWDHYNENVADPKRVESEYGPLANWQGKLQSKFEGEVNRFGVGPYYYFTNWSYFRLAEERYPDAVVKDDTVVNSIEHYVRNNGPDVRTFPMGNRAEADLKQDLTDIWNTYPVSGFGHDVALGGVKYRGPFPQRIPGRAWDEQGVYADVSVAIAHSADLVHALPRKQFAPGFWSGGGQQIYSIAARSDAGGFEGTKYHLAGWGDRIRYARYVMGTKGIQLFGGDHRDHSTDYYDWQTATPQQISQVYLREGRAALVQCFRWGMPPTTDTGTGFQELMELVYLLSDELLPYGWQLIPAATATNGVEVARYGNGANTRLVLINPSGIKRTTTVTAYSQDAGATALVFGRIDTSQIIENKVEGNTTTFTTTLEPGEIAAFPAVADFTPAVRGTWRASMRDNDGGGWTFTVAGAPSANTTVHFPTPLGHRLGDGVAEAPLAAGIEAQTIGRYVSKVFNIYETDIRKFRFYEDNAPLATLVIPEQASPEVIRAATALREYFRFYTQEVKLMPRPVLLPVAMAGAKTTGRTVVFQITTKEPSVTVTPGDTPSILISAPENRLVDVTRDMMKLLDKEYPFYGTIPASVYGRPNETKAREKAGISNAMVLKSGEIVHTSSISIVVSSRSRAVEGIR